MFNIKGAIEQDMSNLTPEELKKLLAPETFQCNVCKKTYPTLYEARQCEHIDRLAQQKAEQELKNKIEEDKKGGEKLKKVLEENLT